MSVVQRTSRGLWRRAALLMGLSTCRSSVEPPLPHGAQAFAAPAVYETWWQMVEACSGITSSLAKVSWFQLPNSANLPYEGLPDVSGYWQSRPDEIVLAGASVLDGGIVRHEMLHALLDAPGHPRAAFLTSCGGVVECNEACIADAGQLTTANASTPRVSPSQLDVQVTVDPAVPAESLNGGFFTVIVTARNPSSTPVVVPLPPRGLNGNGPALSFMYLLQGPLGGVENGALALDSGVFRFAPGETKRQVFDFEIGDAGLPQQLSPGVYSVGGAYGGKWVYDTVRLMR